MWSLETETKNLENMDEKLELVLKSTNAGTRLQESFQDPFDASIKLDDNDALYPISGQSSDSSLPQLQRPIIKFHELNFFSLSSQSNIYGLTKMVCEGDTKLLIATLRGVIYRLSFERNSLQPTWRSVVFSYIPTDAEIISLDAFVREGQGPVVGVTLIKKNSESKEVYFNIYGLHIDSSGPLKWDKIAEDWQALDLKFTPFQLTHTQIMIGDDYETVFLLSGDDLKVHLYRKVLRNDEVCFQEEHSVTTLFPEFQDISSSVTYMDILVSGTHRITAFGCQNGYIRCVQTDLTNNTVIQFFHTSSLDGPITSVKLFNISTHKQTQDSTENGGSLNLLVTSAVELGCIYLDVLQSGLQESPFMLPSSDLHDSVLCSEIANLSFTGQNQIVLGTYGKRLLVYELLERAVPRKYEAELIWEREFAHPIHQVMYCDITGDGLSELVVLSTAGLHILQHDLSQICQICLPRLEVLNDRLTTT